MSFNSGVYYRAIEKVNSTGAGRGGARPGPATVIITSIIVYEKRRRQSLE